MGRDCRCWVLFLGFMLVFPFAAQAQRVEGKVTVKPAEKPQPPPQAHAGTLAGTWLLRNVILASGRPLLPAMQAELKFHQVVISGETDGMYSADEFVIFEDSGQPTITCRQSGEASFKIVRMADHNFIRLGTATLHPASDCGRYAGKTGNVPAGESWLYELSGDTLTFIEPGGGDGVILRIFKRVQPVAR